MTTNITCHYKLRLRVLTEWWVMTLQMTQASLSNASCITSKLLPGYTRSGCANMQRNLLYDDGLWKYSTPEALTAMLFTIWLCADYKLDVVHTCRARFHETAAQHIRKQLQLLAAELPLPPESDTALASMAAAGFGSHVLEDDQCEDDEDPSSEITRRGNLRLVSCMPDMLAYCACKWLHQACI